MLERSDVCIAANSISRKKFKRSKARRAFSRKLRQHWRDVTSSPKSSKSWSWRDARTVSRKIRVPERGRSNSRKSSPVSKSDASYDFTEKSNVLGKLVNRIGIKWFLVSLAMCKVKERRALYVIWNSGPSGVSLVTCKMA